MTFLKLALALLDIISWIMKEAERQRYIKEGEKRAYERSEVLMRGRIEQAMSARAERANADRGASSTDGLRDDGFRRD